MPDTIVATVVADSPIAHVQINLTVTLPAKSYTVSRVGPGGPVPIWYSTPAKPAESINDYVAPLNTPVTYRLQVIDNNGSYRVPVDTAAVTVTGTGCYLTQPSTGRTLAVTLVAWPDRTWKARQAVLEVEARADPVVLGDVHTSPTGTWRYATETDDDTDELTDLLTAQRVVVLRTQPSSSIKSVTVAVLDIAERRRGSTGADQRRWIDVEQQEIGTLPGLALPINATLGGLNTLVPGTLLDLSNLRPTLLGISQVPTP
jgi:hypothetical protein